VEKSLRGAQVKREITATARRRVDAAMPDMRARYAASFAGAGNALFHARCRVVDI